MGMSGAEIKEMQQKKWAREQAKHEPPKKHDTMSKVVVNGVNMPFWDLLVFLVKLALAAVPAAIISAIIISTTLSFLAGVLSR